MVRYYHGFEAAVYYVQESAEGTTPTASPAFLNLAQKAECRISQQPGPNPVKKSGSVDNADIGKGIDNPIINITLTPSQASGKNFIKNFSSTDNSFTLLLMIDEAADVIFARIPGCKVKRITRSVSIYPQHRPLEVTIEIWGWNILYTNAGLTTPTFETAPASIINWSDVTVKKGGATVTDWWSWEDTIENELERMRDKDGVTTAIERGPRTLTGSWLRSANATVGVGSTELDEAKDGTAVNLEFDILTDLYAFADCKYDEVEVAHPITGMVGIRQNFIGESLTIT